MIGKQVSHYKILDRLGSGGMGEVYRAEDTRLRRQVALKFLGRDLLHNPEARRRFALEARAAAILGHPHITTLYEFDADEGFISLELVEGETLDARLARGPLAPAEAARVGRAVAGALAHAHARHVVHRDLKPSNILLGASGAIKLTDFGLAKVRDSSLHTSTDLVLGTASYMCPEQVRGRAVDGRGDLFSLGVVLYQALSGTLPWKGAGIAVLYSIMHDQPPPLGQVRPEIPPALAALVERLMRKEPAERFGGAEEVEGHLAAIVGALSGGGRAGPPPAGSEAPQATAPGAAVAERPLAEIPLVAREAELNLLKDALEEARLGSGRTILIGGEAGVGKSWLMEEFRGYAAMHGARCLRGRCDLQGGRNFGPFVEALEELARGVDQGGQSAASLPAELKPALRMLLEPDAAPGPRTREQLWWLIDSLLKAIARGELLVLMLDDLHWADEGTLSLLNHVTRNLGTTRLLVIGAYRFEELLAPEGREHPLGDLIRLLGPVEAFRRLTLEPLDERGTAALLAAVFGDAAQSRELAAGIHRRAQGNPFFTIEIVRLIEASGGAGEAVRRGRAMPPETLGLPQTVTGVLLRRLTRLSREERDVLDLAAIEGDVFHTDTLEHGTGLPRLAILKRLRSIQQHHQLVIAEEDGQRFAHGLVREVLLREMPAELKREYHAAVAAHLRQRHGERADRAGEIGNHLFEARRFAEALPFLARAAREARRLFLNDRALEFCDRALEASGFAIEPAPGAGVGVDRAGLLIERCQILVLLGRPEEARAAAEEALRHSEAAREAATGAAALEWLGEAALAQGDLAAAGQALDRARQAHARLDGTRALARCDEKLALLAARRGDFEAALARLEAAAATLEREGDERGVARIHLDAGDAHFRRGDFERARERFESGVAEMRRLGERHGLGRGLNLLGNLLFHRGQTDEALARYEEARVIAREIGDLQGLARLEANLGNVHLVRGDSARALASYQDALARFGEIGDRIGMGQIRVALGNVCFARGDFEQAADHYREAIAPRREMGDRWGLGNALHNLGVAGYFLGRWSDALAHVHEAARLQAELGDRPGQTESALSLGNLMAVLGRREEAERHYAEAAALAATLDDPRREARVALARAGLDLAAGDRAGAAARVAAARALADEDPAIRSRRILIEVLAGGEPTFEAREARLRESLAEAWRARAIPEEAAARLVLARALGTAGRSEEARAQLEEALRLVAGGRIPLLELHALGLRRAAATTPSSAADEARVRELIAQLEAALPPQPGPRADFLTPVFPLP
jgi:tetratricopeptide (TPR) repeat protein